VSLLKSAAATSRSLRPSSEIKDLAMSKKSVLITAGMVAGVLGLGYMVATAKTKQDLETVSWVDLSRYSGQWYEIARLPNGFQKKCADSVSANYTLRSDGSVKVVNRCRKESGEFTTATGKAKIVDKTTHAKLKVTFFWPFYGDYWILDLGDNYEYSVVGDSSRKYLWILSRTPQIDEGLYKRLLANMQRKGFDTTRMIRTVQPGTVMRSSEHGLRSIAEDD